MCDVYMHNTEVRCVYTQHACVLCIYRHMCPASCGQQSLVPLTNCSPSLTYVRTYVCTYVPMQQNVLARCKCIQTYDVARCTKYACVLASIRLQMNIRLPCRCLPFNIMTESGCGTISLRTEYIMD